MDMLFCSCTGSCFDLGLYLTGCVGMMSKSSACLAARLLLCLRMKITTKMVISAARQSRKSITPRGTHTFSTLSGDTVVGEVVGEVVGTMPVAKVVMMFCSVSVVGSSEVETEKFPSSVVSLCV